MSKTKILELKTKEHNDIIFNNVIFAGINLNSHTFNNCVFVNCEFDDCYYKNTAFIKPFFKNTSLNCDTPRVCIKYDIPKYDSPIYDIVRKHYLGFLEDFFNNEYMPFFFAGTIIINK